MRKKIASFIYRIGSCFQALSRKIYLSEHGKNVRKWFENDGDNQEWIYHDLDSRSIVYDVGGYKGRFTSDIYTMYQCQQIHVFEPVKKYSKELKKRFNRNKNIIIHSFGLSDKNYLQNISNNKDCSSLYLKGKEYEKIKLVKISDFLTKNKINNVDLLKLNVEGSEFDILENLIHSGKIKIFKNIQVQFHDFVPNAKKHMLDIERKLSKTHRLTYRYEFVWENWYLK